ncbi:MULTISPECIES: M23 family metallopeptidase [unclassified Halobacteriovorax]|uniref:M23 family metallopeptidase n=1 Tax=unclassified Halobacteriovorax TaxID=2639665 RepID=UPI0013C3F373|nr:M23 family metallopeptidase [Halobacteriovorax sp. BALOs_7]
MSKLFISLILLSSLYGCNQTQHVIGRVEASSEMMIASPLRHANIVKKGEVKRGQGLYQALKSIDIDNKQALKLINQLRDEVEFSKLKVGDRLEATYDEFNNLIKFSFSQNEYETHVVTLNENSGKWDYSLEELETYWQPRMIEGQLKTGSTLQDDLLALGLERSVVNEVVNVLLCKVNFRMHARAGDRYKVLLSERKHDKKTVQTKVLFTSYSGIKAGSHDAYFYEDKEKSSTYTAHYTPDGQALINAGLRYPLPRLHIRSSYGWRMHPVTGRRAMHRGIDLRGRTGERVHAVAAGKVIMSTYNKYAGNKIAIRHRDGSTSYYYHLNRRSVGVGAWVRSHQVIGTVGATGRVTGPHLHFGFKDRRGRWMNPLNKRMIATPKLKGERLANLRTQVQKIKGTIADLEISKDSKYLVANLDKIKRFPSAIDRFDFLQEEN